MLGAIIGDVIGSVHEGAGTKTKDFPLLVPESTFTDDSVLTIAVADWILGGADLVDLLHSYTRNYPDRGYGFLFYSWALSDTCEPYHSFGNGSAMRVSPVGLACRTMDEVLARAEQSAAVTHNHAEGIRGAQATAAAVYLAHHGGSKEEIRRFVEERFRYDLRTPLDEIRPTYEFDETCQRTVPPAIIAFLESTDFEDAIRNAISLGGDADTLACITGGIAEAHYGGVPPELEQAVRAMLDERLLSVVDRFRERYGGHIWFVGDRSPLRPYPHSDR